MNIRKLSDGSWNSSSSMAYPLNQRNVNFEKTSVKYLRVVVSHDSVKIDPAKVAVVYLNS